MNKVCLIGRIANDLELKTTGSGKTMCEFDLAVHRAFDKNATDFLKCVVWNAAAENLVKYQGKGDMIAVDGSIQIEKYVTSNNENRRKHYIIVGNIEYLGGKREKKEFNGREIGEDLPF